MVDPNVLFGTGQAVNGGNFTELAKFEVALVAVPLAVAFLRPSASEAKALASAWAISAILNAAAAVGDASGHTSISATLLGYTGLSGRQAGLTEQANNLGAALALTTPVVLYWLSSHKALIKAAGVLTLALFAYSSLLVGSRGDFLALCLAAGLYVLLIGRLQRAVLLLLLLTSTAAVVLIAFPWVLSIIATDIRLAGQLGAASDAAHATALQQGLSDFQQSPIYGIGFDHLIGASEVHLQLLAAGGITALCGYLVYWATVLKQGYIARQIAPRLASALFATAITFMFLNLVENEVADRYLYIPAAIAVSLVAWQANSVPRQQSVGGLPSAPRY